MQQGVSRKSQLFDSLKVYLNKTDRLQPIIGLGSIVECVKVGTQNREALYVCEVCVCRLTKADMRNHILGSLHRFSYIKAWHPYLVSEWQENSDKSKLARPLMEMAEMLEGKEGPGEVQLLEVEDAVYQKMATHSESDVITLIKSLRYGQGESESHSGASSLHYPIQSQRIVLLAQNQQRWSEKSLKADVKSHKVSAHTNKSPPVNSTRVVDDYSESKPLIGLLRVVECRSEDGCSYCFLCHCCRIRSNKKDITDHLTSSSHLFNYLMETHPEEVEVMTADVEDNCQLLQSLAKKVEQEEGRGELKVVHAPESLCMQLTGKSYHWCIKMLFSGQTHTNTRKKRIAVEGPRVNETSVRGTPERYAAMLSKQAKKKMTKKKRKVTDTVFSVSLPLRKGSMLLERTSFSMDSLSGLSVSPSSDSDLISSPDSQIVDCELDCDTGSFAGNYVEETLMSKNAQLQQDLSSGDTDAGQYIPESNFADTLFEDGDGYVDDYVYVIQPEGLTGTKDHLVYGERTYDRQHGSQEASSKDFYKQWKNKDLQKQNEGLLPAVPPTQDWSSYNSSYRHESCSEQWYHSTSTLAPNALFEGSREERHKDMSSDATQHYCQQHLKNQYMACEVTSLTGSVGGYHGLSGQLAPYLDAARLNMKNNSGDLLTHSGSIVPDPRVQFETEQRRLQAYMEFTIDHVQRAPQSYSMASTAYPDGQVGNRLMSNPSYSSGPWTNPDQHFAHAFSSSGTSGVMTQPNAFIQPGQALWYGPHSDLSFRTNGCSDVMISGRVDGNTPVMIAYPGFNSESVATPHWGYNSTQGTGVPIE